MYCYNISLGRELYFCYICFRTDEIESGPTHTHVRIYRYGWVAERDITK